MNLIFNVRFKWAGLVPPGAAPLKKIPVVLVDGLPFYNAHKQHSATTTTKLT